MKIVHLNTYDATGGAARAAYRLHLGLRLMGHESRMFVQNKQSDDPTVIRFERRRDLLRRFTGGMVNHLLPVRYRPMFSVGPPFFSDDRGEDTEEVIRQLPSTDVLHVHWIARFIESSVFFRRYPKNVPIVWTLHDMNALTGGCHFDGGCGKYLTHCGRCPQLGSKDVNDHSWRSWERKSATFAAVSRWRIHVVAPSRWLAREAEASKLLGRFLVSVIPNGVDTELFQPRDRQLARQLFKIPPNANVILFVADQAGEKRKGLEQLIEAVTDIEDVPELCLFVLGRGIPIERLGKQKVIATCVRDDLTLSLAYSSADLLVVPSLQDNLPNTALEATACGTPTVTFAVGGCPEIVRHGQTGAVVPVGDIRALREAISGILNHSDHRASMARECRRLAATEYNLETQAKRYVELYKAFVAKGLPLALI